MDNKISYERYQRQLLLKDFGEAGQHKLFQAAVSVIGAGGLGCALLQYLVAAGVGRIGIIDDDIVSLSNLHRQVLYSTDDIGLPKAKQAIKVLSRLNPEIDIIGYNERLTVANALTLMEEFDIIVDCTDNFATRYLINDASVLLDKPLVYGAVSRFEGQVAIFNCKTVEKPEAVNYRDLYPTPPKEGEILNCEEAGVLGVLPGAAYLFYGVVLNGFLGRQFSGRFIPSLLLSPINYINWASEANMAAGGVTIVLALLGFFIARDRSLRIYLFGLWGAYVLYGLYFDYHIATHDYYQLPFIPLVAISIAPAADWLMSRLAELTTGRWTRLAATGVLLYGVLATGWQVRGQIKAVDYRPEAARWALIGNRLGHGQNVVALTQDYGQRLNYWGWQNAIIWPNSNDIDYHELRGTSINSRTSFANVTKGKTYFLVTDFIELNRQPVLKQDLAALPVYAQGEGFIIYDLRKP